MQTYNLVQGAPEWHHIRGQYFTASQAPAMLGISPYKTRDELLREKKTGVKKEKLDEIVAARGHEFEALAREELEKILEEEFYPVTGVKGKLLASFDGVTMDGEMIFEHKTMNKILRECKTQDDIPEHVRAQIEQQLYVSGAGMCHFVASSWDGKNLKEWKRIEVKPDQSLRARILSGWEQFEKDLENYTPQESAHDVIGAAPESLPALRIEINGAVTASNLDDFKNIAIARFSSIKTDLETDQDFADAESTVKWCKCVEDKLEAAKQHALSQTAGIDELFKAIDAIKESAREKRLQLDKTVKARKNEIREALVAEANKKLEEHQNELQAGVKECAVPKVHVNFGAAVKGLKTVESMQNALDSVLLKTRCECDSVARATRDKIAFLESKGEKYFLLFQDLDNLVCESSEALAAIADNRIAKFEEPKKQPAPCCGLAGKIDAFLASKSYGRNEKKIREALGDFVEFCNRI